MPGASLGPLETIKRRRVVPAGFVIPADPERLELWLETRVTPPAMLAAVVKVTAGREHGLTSWGVSDQDVILVETPVYGGDTFCWTAKPVNGLLAVAQRTVDMRYAVVGSAVAAGDVSYDSVVVAEGVQAGDPRLAGVPIYD